MAEEKQQDGQKTIVAFVVGLLIGGMLVWAFSGSNSEAPHDQDERDHNTEEVAETEDDNSVVEATTEEDTPVEVPTLSVGEGDVVVNDQPAGTAVALDSATYPVSEGWIGVQDFNNEQLGFILGVVRFSESQGLVPDEIVLQRATTPGNNYAIVIFTEDGDFNFNLAGDVRIDTIYDTFTAQ